MRFDPELMPRWIIHGLVEIHKANEVHPKAGLGFLCGGADFPEGNLTLIQEDENRLTSVGGWMSQVVPPPESDHSTWELEKATAESPSEDPGRSWSSWV